ncbi:MAG: hypothetical protein CMH62_00955 [Nanoarchaeota archaeon]|nr:hypothetical protein [Nanoarchaeota archaeon]
MVDVDRRDKILEFVRKEGAVLPIKISKEFNIDTMFSGAMLSELVNSGKIKVTEHLKVGGTPVYYVEGMEAKLEDYTKFLNEKDIRTIAFLKDKGIVEDKGLSPLQRVSYRIVKDFAKSIVLKRDDGSKEVFWRYFLVDEEAAKEKILDLINNKKEDVKVKVEKQASLEEPALEEEVHEEKELPEEKPLEEPLQREVPERIEVKKKPIGDVVKEFFRVNGITVWEEKVIRKGKDVNYLVSFDSRVGKVRYFAKYRDKKRISEGDVSLAYNEAGKLPLLFLSKGELTKPAKRIIEEEFKGVIFKRLSR